jgi:hypothetical protein
MRKACLLFLTVAIACGTGCATSYVAADFDHDVDFSAYHTFAWQPHDLATGAGDSITDTDLLAKRVRRAATEALAAGGYTAAASGTTADFVVAYRIVEATEIEAERHGSLMGGGWTTPSYFPVTDIDVASFATLIIDVLDGDSGTLAWRGWCRLAISGPSLAAPIVHEAVSDILGQFPPAPCGAGAE